MATFGKYETVAELHRGGLGSLWSARQAGEDSAAPARFAVRTCQPDADIIGPDHADLAVRRFLEASATQQKLAGAGCAHWAPIHDLGQIRGGGAYVVTDLYAGSSVERLISRRVKVDGAGLANVVRSVVGGLEEIVRTAKRPHGNLKASNVLLAEADPARARVVITDPLADSQVKAGRDTGSDLRGIGELIHLLVLNQPFRERSAWPVADSPEWKRLGRGGDAWRELCNALLKPGDEADRPTLEQVAATIAKIGGGKRRPLGLMVSVAVLVVAGAGVGGYLALRGGGWGGGGGGADKLEFNVDAWIELCNSRWLFQLWERQLEEPMPGADGKPGPTKRKEVYRRDTELAAMVKSLGDAISSRSLEKPEQVADVGPEHDRVALRASPPEKMQHDNKALRTIDTSVKAIRAVKKTLADWTLPGHLAAKADEYQQQHRWGAPAAYLKSVSDQAKSAFDTGNNVVLAIDAALAAWPVVERIDASWKAIDKDIAVLTETKDKVLGAFDAYASKAAASEAGATHAAKDLGALDKTLAEVRELGGRLADYVGEEEWKNGIDRQQFLAEGPVYKSDLESPSALTFNDWMSQAKAYRNIDPNTDPRRAWGARAVLEDVLKQRDKVNARDDLKQDKAIADLTAKIEDVRKDVEKTSLLAWSRDNQEQITKDTRRLEADLRTLKSDLELGIQRIDGIANTTADEILRRDNFAKESALNLNWTTWRAALLRRYPVPEKTREFVGAAVGIENFLLRFDGAMQAKPVGAPAGAEWGAGLAVLVSAERERLLTEVLGRLGAQGVPEPDSPEVHTQVDAVVKDYGAWVESVHLLVADLGTIETMLNQGYALDDEATESTTIRGLYDRRKDFLMDARNAALKDEVKPVLDRITRLAEVQADRDRVRLVAAVKEQARQGAARRPEIAITAWRGLGSLDSPTWPASVAELHQEQDLLASVRQVVGLLGESRRNFLKEELSRGGRQRWQACAGKVTTRADIEDVLGRMEAMGVTEADLSGRLRYDWLLWRLHQVTANAALADLKGDLTVAEEIGKVLAGVDALPTEIKGRSEVADVVGQLKPIVEGQEPAVKTVPPETLGPATVTKAGASAWEGKATDDKHVVFKPVAAVGEPLEFMRVEADGQGVKEPFYLLTSEVSVGMFASIVDAQGGWSSLSVVDHWDEWKLKEPDPRYGVCAWTWSRDGRMVPTADWITHLNPQASAATPAYPNGLLDPAPQNWTRIVAKQAPSLESPMQQVSPVAALYAARLAGCRLPTPEEWQAADRLMEPIAAEQKVKANRRDLTWGKQQQHIRETLNKPGFKPNLNYWKWPDEGEFLPKGQEGLPKGDKAVILSGYDDGVLWFEPVKSDLLPIHHLVGNVAEYVMEGADEAANADPKPEVLRGLVGKSSSAVSVIGGSAISDPGIKVNEPLPLAFTAARPGDPAEPGYADVGFRLVFSAKGTAPARQSYASRLKGILDAPDGRYLLGP